MVLGGGFGPSVRSAHMAAVPEAAAVEAAAECRARWALGLKSLVAAKEKKYVLGGGFEPPCLAALAPQASVSASSTIPAKTISNIQYQKSNTEHEFVRCGPPPFVVSLFVLYFCSLIFYF